MGKFARQNSSVATLKSLVKTFFVLPVDVALNELEHLLRRPQGHVAVVHPVVLGDAHPVARGVQTLLNLVWHKSKIFFLLLSELESGSHPSLKVKTHVIGESVDHTILRAHFLQENFFLNVHKSNQYKVSF